MTDSIRIIPHSPEGIPDTGSFEVVWPCGKRCFYWDDLPGRRAITQHLSGDEALEQARALARKQGALIRNLPRLDLSSGYCSGGVASWVIGPLPLSRVATVELSI
jgi:hypothetical protein